jgi:hypothetical protein
VGDVISFEEAFMNRCRKTGASGREAGEGPIRNELEALLAFLGPDRKLAGERYTLIRRRLVRLFEWRSLAFAEDLADEAIIRVARRIAEGVELRSADTFAYVCGVAHLVSNEVLLHRAARERTEPRAEPAQRLPSEFEDELWIALEETSFPELAEELRPLEEGEEIPEMEEIGRAIGEIYGQISKLIAEQPGDPAAKETVRRLRERLRVLQREEAEAMERRFRSQLLFDPRKGRDAIARAERLLGKL